MQFSLVKKTEDLSLESEGADSKEGFLDTRLNVFLHGLNPSSVTIVSSLFALVSITYLIFSS